MSKRLVILSVLILVLTACGEDAQSNDTGQQRLFDWDRSADFVLFRLDEVVEDDDELVINNTIPPCTIYGNGRLIFTNEGDDFEVLEARLNDDQIRAYIENAIGLGFYGWEDDLLEDSGNETTGVPLRSISLNLYAEPRTIERYSGFPVDGFEQLLNDCRNLSEQRALVAPLNGGWLRVAPAEDVTPDDLFVQGWPRTAPFSLIEISNSGSSFWVADQEWATALWEFAIRPQRIAFFEEGRGFYISLQIPGVSRNSPPAPATGS